MKRLLLSGVLLLAVMVGSSGAFGADFQRGLDAYNRGDYVAAFKELAPLVEQGDYEAQFMLGGIRRRR